MSMVGSSNLGPSGGAPKPRSRGAMIALVVALAVVLFGAGVALSWFLRGGTGAAAPSVSPSAVCVTTTAKPAATLPKPGQVSANVYNATNRTGLAGRTAVVLKGRGFTIGTVANDPLKRTIPGTAEIRYGAKGAQNAQLMRYYIAGATLVKDTRTDASIDVVLGEKFTNVRSQAAVDAAIAKPVVTETGPGCAAASPSAS